MAPKKKREEIKNAAHDIACHSKVLHEQHIVNPDMLETEKHDQEHTEYTILLMRPRPPRARETTPDLPD
jgi:hypothetical protein